MTSLVEGQPLIVDIEFRTDAGTLIDPTTTKCLVRAPSGILTTHTYPSAQLVRLDVGQYEASVTADESGTWHFRAVGTGAIEAIQEVAANVAASNVI